MHTERSARAQEVARLEALLARRVRERDEWSATARQLAAALQHAQAQLAQARALLSPYLERP